MKQQTKTVFWLCLIAVIGIFAYSSYLKRNPIEKDVDYDKDITDRVETIVSEELESKYLGNKLENGSSPAAKKLSCFALQSSLKIPAIARL